MSEQWLLKKKPQHYFTLNNNFSPLFLEILNKRYFNNIDEIESYIKPNIANLHNYELLPHILPAAEFILSCLKNGYKIRIVGDYDVDGIMSTYILYNSLKDLGAKVDFRIPHRVDDGYGINKRIVEEAKDDNIHLIITCDNGIQAFEALEYAYQVGVNVIVTDHHECKVNEFGETLTPKCVAAVDPKIDNQYPFSGICGAVVSLKLIQYLYNIIKKDTSLFFEKFSPYAAIATICDVMDIIDENRIIVHYGLKLLNRTSNIGLKALIDAAELHKNITVYDVGFIIGPTLNASGRLESAILSLECLNSDNYAKALKYAVELRELNDKRKTITENGIREADKKIIEEGLAEDKVLVLYTPDIHESVAGIVAGKVKEKYYKPTIVITDSGELAKGSARSVEGYNIFLELSKLNHYFIKFGGHEMAAGLSLEKSKINDFRIAVNKAFSSDESVLIPKVYVDVICDFNVLTFRLAEELNIMEPYGKGNPQALFATLGVKVEEAKLIGKNKNFISLTLSKNGILMKAVCFSNTDVYKEMLGLDEYGYFENIVIDVVYNLNVNIFNNSKNLQLIIKSMRCNHG